MLGGRVLFMSHFGGADAGPGEKLGLSPLEGDSLFGSLAACEAHDFEMS